ncbi:leucyl aminopeptidase [Solemya velum gill symbiont]|uniref:leucyl aminopeptidase n=1 Tax=Solemya velum gill symbiont TaxID=2340 RepID=UPI0009981D97|nr:leucyl aminopeptidase [Solemya velum gill symbiont]OOY52420.1 leucyl aminopeptidase [Solemya velum gill symbiont]OOY54933.1 leucyl aminopeptidase [Solemya velum gill symbiont]OOY55696.1 leucyl aminopeptidase [Solemya velum gill symbiont]OOY60608.1 leucyl aminopeptidase [Solemya velum gill symbiont]OOY62515.1 leucyl aminopeptidase [Solemya velum gill symbiont]
MQITLSKIDLAKTKTRCLILFSTTQQEMCKEAEAIDKASNGLVKRQLVNSGFNGKAGETALLCETGDMPCECLLVVGLGDEDEFNISQLQKGVSAAMKNLLSMKVGEAIIGMPAKSSLTTSTLLRETAQALVNATYNFSECKSDDDKPHKIRKIRLSVSNSKQLAGGRKSVQQGEAIALGMEMAKNLADLPGNICTPAYLARKAGSLGRKYKSISTKVINEKEMEKLKMGALLSVSRGSRQPAKLIIMEYKGGKKGDKPVVLVGKGLTFDAGGISIKPSARMDEMKYDMCGGASVIGTIKAVAEMELPINIVGVVPSSENLPDGDANKPGDIVTSMAGKTIEILNTDAEGRLILCDALTYSKRFKPDTVIDIATLTGACIVALGNHASGLMANSEEVASDLISAGESCNDRTWRLPLWDEYQPQLDSNFADIANIGGPAAGTITAGCFLSRFTEDFNWAHLDIAGTAWKSGAEKGATGRPVPLLVNYLINKAG